MKPGRELDALVAKEIMGFSNIKVEGNRVISKVGPHTVQGLTISEYSTNIASAWEVVMQMNNNGFKLELRSDNFGSIANFYDEEGENWCGEYLDAPYAICLAALKAKGIEVHK